MVCLSQHDTYVLEIAALLHDLGKIGVPDSILHKPGKLDESEWKVMTSSQRSRASTWSGERSIAMNSTRSSVATTASQRHDDRPARLISKRATVAARLLNIADTYDSMVSDQAYRHGCSSAEAIKELRRCAGTQFDPELVERFIEHTVGLHARIGVRFCHHSRNRGRTAETILIPNRRPYRRIGQGDGQPRLVVAEATVRQVESRSPNRTSCCQSPNAPSVSPRKTDEAEEDVQWSELLEDLQTLIDLCRSTQNAHLTESVE